MFLLKWTCLNVIFSFHFFFFLSFFHSKCECFLFWCVGSNLSQKNYEFHFSSSHPSWRMQLCSSHILLLINKLNKMVQNIWTSMILFQWQIKSNFDGRLLDVNISNGFTIVNDKFWHENRVICPLTTMSRRIWFVHVNKIFV